MRGAAKQHSPTIALGPSLASGREGPKCGAGGVGFYGNWCGRRFELRLRCRLPGGWGVRMYNIYGGLRGNGAIAGLCFGR